ncbi:MAG: hypothetical protein HYV04_12650 [Deltaproteobacteria bacterium]|nr:hypothetical protein [Deltaproteobacteria bacterium]
MKRGLLAFAFALVMPAVIVSTHSVASAVWYGSFWWDKDQNVYTIISVTNIGSVSEIVTVNFLNMGGTKLTDYTTVGA